MIRLFVADIDGTLLNEKSQLEERTVCAIRRFQKRGCLFMVATGRNSWELEVVSERIDDLIINCVNGALLCDKQGKTIFSAFVKEDEVVKADSWCRDKYADRVSYRNRDIYLLEER